jgi:DNA-binding PadR family transcriptional regulator
VRDDAARDVCKGAIPTRNILPVAAGPTLDHKGTDMVVSGGRPGPTAPMRATSLQYAVLGLIASKSEGIHGYRLKEECEAVSEEFWALNYGRLYRVLDAMERSGDLCAADEIQHGKPNRRVYRITHKGRRTLDDWLLEPASASQQPLRDELALKLLFLRSDRVESLHNLLRDQRATYLKRLAQVNRRRRRLRRAGLEMAVIDLVLDGAEMRVRADLAWLDHIERKVLRS